MKYSELTRKVSNNEILILPDYSYKEGMVEMYNNKVEGFDNAQFVTEYKFGRPSFVLKWDMFNLSLSFAMPGLLKTRGMGIPTVMYKSIYMVKDCMPCDGDLIVRNLLSENAENMESVSPFSIEYDELFGELSFNDYMKHTVTTLELGAENKVIAYYMKSSEKELTLPGVSYEDTSYMKSLGLSGHSFNPRYGSTKSTESPIKVSIKSFSNIPSVPSVLAKIEKNTKLTPSDSLIAKYIEKCSLLSSDELTVRSKIVAEQYDALRDLTRATNYSVLYKDYRFGMDSSVDEHTGTYDNYTITFEVNR